MLETGLISKWKGHRLQNHNLAPCDDQSTTTEAKRLVLTTLQGPFFILGIGLSLGLIGLFVELIVYNKLRAKVHPSSENDQHDRNMQMASHT